MPKDPKEQRTADLINHNLNRAFNIPLEDKPLVLPSAPDSKREALKNITSDASGRRFMLTPEDTSDAMRLDNANKEEAALEDLRRFHEEQQRKQTERDRIADEWQRSETYKTLQSMRTPEHQAAYDNDTMTPEQVEQESKLQRLARTPEQNAQFDLDNANK
jgi:hypothetical protein